MSLEARYAFAQERVAENEREREREREREAHLASTPRTCGLDDNWNASSSVHHGVGVSGVVVIARRGGCGRVVAKECTYWDKLITNQLRLRLTASLSDNKRNNITSKGYSRTGREVNVGSKTNSVVHHNVLRRDRRRMRELELLVGHRNRSRRGHGQENCERQNERTCRNTKAGGGRGHQQVWTTK